MAHALHELAVAQDIVLVKGSNGMGMNTVIELYIAQCNTEELA